VAAELYARFPQLSEGKLTRFRASLVREEALAELARELGLAALVRLGEGELMAAAEPRPSILADALEAVFGAVLIDAGYDAAREAVLAVFGPRLERVDPERAAKDANFSIDGNWSIRVFASSGTSSLPRRGEIFWSPPMRR